MKALHGRQRGRLIQLQIAVLAQDIRHAKRSSSQRCPIGRAIARRFGVLDDDISVDYERLGIRTPRRWRLFLIDKRCEDWMSRFDNGKRVKPTWFLFDEVRG